MNEFCNSWIDEEGRDISYFYYTTKKFYLYEKLYINGVLIHTKRISESAYMSAYDTHYNY